MSIVAQWEEIAGGLREDWADAQLVLTVEEEGECARAAALLGPLNPGRSERRVRFFTARRGAGFGPDAVRRLLRRIDQEGIEGRLELVSSGEAEPVPEAPRESLAEAWDAALAGLPEDWSDLYAEIELSSTDYLEPAALRLAPVNPARYGGKPGFRFRCARRFGYGVSAEMARRCFERLDEAGIDGELRILRVLSDSKPVGTQGPVWLVGGRSV